jgi:hypothetical protein
MKADCGMRFAIFRLRAAQAGIRIKRNAVVDRDPA